jgi:hypothetical protein
VFPQGFQFPAKHDLGRRIHKTDHTVQTDHDDGVGIVGNQRVQTRLNRLKAAAVTVSFNRVADNTFQHDGMKIALDQTIIGPFPQGRRQDRSLLGGAQNQDRGTMGVLPQLADGLGDGPVRGAQITDNQVDTAIQTAHAVADGIGRYQGTVQALGVGQHIPIASLVAITATDQQYGAGKRSGRRSHEHRVARSYSCRIADPAASGL